MPRGRATSQGGRSVRSHIEPSTFAVSADGLTLYAPVHPKTNLNAALTVGTTTLARTQGSPTRTPARACAPRLPFGRDMPLLFGDLDGAYEMAPTKGIGPRRPNLELLVTQHRAAGSAMPSCHHF